MIIENNNIKYIITWWWHYCERGTLVML